MPADPLAGLAARIRAAKTMTILTGAGVSAASGVPTFRGAGGLWRSFRAEDLATPEAFERDPRLVWEWYAWRRETIAGCGPNAAHEVIARWSARQRPSRVHGLPAEVARGPAEEAHAVVNVITQNVDDLHLRAGTPRVTRLHGSIWQLSCPACAVTWRDERVPLPDLPPRCTSCGGLARPAVVWFGESLAPADIEAAIQACQCDLFLTVGTSAVVYPAAGLVHEARRRGAYTAEINAEVTPASSMVDIAIQGAAEDILPRLDRLIYS